MRLKIDRREVEVAGENESSSVPLLSPPLTTPLLPLFWTLCAAVEGPSTSVVTMDGSPVGEFPPEDEEWSERPRNPALKLEMLKANLLM